MNDETPLDDPFVGAFCSAGAVQSVQRFLRLFRKGSGNLIRLQLSAVKIGRHIPVEYAFK